MKKNWRSIESAVWNGAQSCARNVKLFWDIAYCGAFLTGFPAEGWGRQDFLGIIRNLLNDTNLIEFLTQNVVCRSVDLGQQAA